MISPPPDGPTSKTVSLAPQEVVRAASLLIEREELLIEHLRSVRNALLRREIEAELCEIRRDLRILGFPGEFFEAGATWPKGHA
jgi:hypothetical protein